MRRRRVVGGALSVLVIAVVALWISDEWSGNGTGNVPTGSPGTVPRLTVGLVAIGARSDRGYVRQHAEGLRAVELALGPEVRARMVESVDPEKGERVFQELCDSGAGLIIATATEYGDALLATAVRNPDVKFLHCFGPKQAANVSTCGVSDWEGAYICGGVAATTVGGAALGCVVPHAARPSSWIVNAFALGVRAVRPETRVLVAPIGSWYDPAAEEKAVKKLAARGARAIYFCSLRPFAGIRAAERAGIRVLYHFADLSDFAGSSWLTGTVWHWSSLYLKVTREILAGQWSARHHEGGFREGFLSLASFGPGVETATWKLAADLVGDMVAGERDIFVGPLLDAKGQTRVPPGTVLEAGGIRAIDWFLAGIEVLAIDGS